MEKPICLITGATDGIGKATATALARKGYAVVLAARNDAKAATVTSEIVASTGNRDVDYLTADLRSLAQLHRLADTFMTRYPRLDVLINNAGVILPERVLTEDGFETTFQVNYLAQFYLTQLLLNTLESSPQGRVVNLSSSVYAPASSTRRSCIPNGASRPSAHMRPPNFAYCCSPSNWLNDSRRHASPPTPCIPASSERR